MHAIVKIVKIKKAIFDNWAGTKEIGFEQDRNNKIGKNGTQNRVSEI